jgi:hypothetical protein
VIARLGGVLLLPCYFIRLSGVILHLKTSTTVNISGLCQNESLKWKSCLSTQLSVDVGFVAGFLYLMFSHVSSLCSSLRQWHHLSVRHKHEQGRRRC